MPINGDTQLRQGSDISDNLLRGEGILCRPVGGGGWGEGNYLFCISMDTIDEKMLKLG